MASQNLEVPKEAPQNVPESLEEPEQSETPEEEAPETGEGPETPEEGGEKPEEEGGAEEEVVPPDVELPEWLSSLQPPPVQEPPQPPPVQVPTAQEPGGLLTPAEAAEMYTDPAKVLNLALARLSQRIESNLGRAEAERQTQDHVENTFFQTYPELAPHKHFVRAIAVDLGTNLPPQTPFRERLKMLATESYKQLAPLIARDRKASGQSSQPKVKATKSESSGVRGPGGPKSPRTKLQDEIDDLVLR